MAQYIFITGGVVSSLGKGIASAALAALLQARGYKTRLRKLDPYLNVDPGTMSPYQHGEVFVTDDGAETDLDLGHYERFTGRSATASDNITTGRIYQDIIARERRGDYLGATVQVIPHVTDRIKDFILTGDDSEDFILCEIGGTVGDIEALPFFEAIRQLGNTLGPKRVIYIHLTLVPFIPCAQELKTKPTQHSVKELRSIGIQPDILLLRCDRPIPDSDRRKLSLFCSVPENCVIPALDLASIYEVPRAYHEAGLDRAVLQRLSLPDSPQPDLSIWEDISKRLQEPQRRVRIAVIGKYVRLKDSYKSLAEALLHGGLPHYTQVEIVWVEAESFQTESPESLLSNIDGILVPGGFGERGAEGKIAAIRSARLNKIPFFGICLGMQMAVIEAARTVEGLETANSSEFGPTQLPVVGLMTEWTDGTVVRQQRPEGQMGGTMRLGAYPALLDPESKIAEIYQAHQISERHRHRYEVNKAYRDALESAGLSISAFSPDGVLPEAVERRDHPWFLAVQYHPELKSRPFAPHPLFTSFIGAALTFQENRTDKAS